MGDGDGRVPGFYGALVWAVVVDGRPVLVAGDGEPGRTWLQNRQAELLLAALAQQEGSIIVGCDCNSKESSSSYRMLAETLANAAHSRPTFSLPGASPDRNVQHIDYILYRGNLRANGTYVIHSSGGSDHQPIVAIFSVPDAHD
ncbi:MAG TPA: hypothetical protein PLD25_05830 [Chloroflexota bacterium]|nr:hypothetical protein [Chloroflexota bacterium]HUM72473.1 hypothetical protein [Chloroflexota bacterium]